MASIFSGRFAPEKALEGQNRVVLKRREAGPFS